MSSVSSLSDYLSRKGPDLIGLLRDTLNEYHHQFNPVTLNYRRNSRQDDQNRTVDNIRKKELSTVTDVSSFGFFAPELKRQTSKERYSIPRISVSNRSSVEDLSLRRSSVRETLRNMGGTTPGRREDLRKASMKSVPSTGNLLAAITEDAVKVSPNKRSSQGSLLSNKRSSRGNVLVDKRGSQGNLLSDKGVPYKGNRRGSKGPVGFVGTNNDATAQQRGKAGKKKLKMRNRLIKIGRIVLVCVGLCRKHANALSELLKNFESLDALVDQKKDERRALLFDLSEYKSQNEARMPKEAKRILKKDPKLRTEAQLQYLKIALRNYEAIAEYPVYMQALIAERAWYESYDPKRMIVREGTNPLRFYFILSGNVIISKFDQSKNLNNTVGFLGRGDSFGELAIINATKRDASVITKTTVEFLCLSDDDFRHIFLSGGLSNPNDPFLNSLWYFKGWPLKLIGENPKKAVYNFYKRNVVLTQNTARTSWLYIVKSGSVDVYKKLKLEKDGETFGILQLKHKNAHQQTSEVQQAKLNAKFSEYVRQIQSSKMLQQQLMQPQLMDIQVETWPAIHAYSVVPKIKNTSSIETIAEDTIEPRSISWKPEHKAGPVLSKVKLERALQAHDPHRVAYLNSSVTHYDLEVDEEGEERAKNKGEQQLAPDAQFVILQTLTKGQCFGLADVVYFTHTSYSLVSNGAEVITIDKKFYMDNTTERLKTDLRELIYPYPTDDNLQKLLDDTINWDHRCKQTLETTLQELHEKKKNIHDCRAT